MKSSGPTHLSWTKRGVIAGVVLIAGIGLLRIVWGRIAYHRLEQELQEYRNAGQPVDLDDFNRQLDGVVPERNAALRLEQAIDAMVHTTATGVSYENFLYDPPEQWDWEGGEAKNLMTANAEVLRLVRKAQEFPDVAWSARLSLDEDASRVMEQRQLAKFLWFATAYYIHVGNQALAVDVLGDLVATSDAIQSAPTFTAYLVGDSCFGLAFMLLERHLAELQIMDGPEGLTDSISAPRRSEVQALLDTLLNEKPVRRNASRSYLGTRALALHSMDQVGWSYSMSVNGLMGTLGSPWDDVIDFMMYPAVVLDVERDVREYTLSAKAMAMDSWPIAQDLFVNASVTGSMLNRMSRPTTYTMWGPSTAIQGVKACFRGLARRRMAALAIAVRLYDIDHGGRPVELQDLVPGYLDTLPADPFSPAGKTFGYRPDAERPFLYTVDVDGVDNGGEVVTRNGKRDIGKSDRRFHLAPEPNN